MHNLLRLAKRYRWIVQFVLIVLTTTATCSYSILAIDRSLAEFIQRTAKTEWVLVAQTLNAVSILVPFVFVLVLVHHYVITGEEKRSHNRILGLIISVCEARSLYLQMTDQVYCRRSRGIIHKFNALFERSKNIVRQMG
jgi:hypothetical protein